MQGCKIAKHARGFPQGRKTAEAHKGLKSLVIRIYSSILCGLLRFTRPLCAPYGDDDNKEFKNFDNKGF